MSDDYAFSDGYDAAYDSMYEERRELEKKVEQLELRLEGIKRLEVELQHREEFIRRLMAELRKHGWGDFHYGAQQQDPNIVALLREGYQDYEHPFVIMQEGNIYERGSDQSGAPTEEAGTSERTTTGEVPLC